MQITIASIQTNAPKMGTVQTTDGRKLVFWKDKLLQLGLQGNGTYEVETEPWHDKTLITKAKLVAAGAPPPAAATNGNGNGHSCQFRTPEQMFVSELLVAYIANGRCEPQKLTETINYVRMAWNRTFGGNDGVFTPREAGHYGVAAE